MHQGSGTLFSEAHREEISLHLSNLAGVLGPGPTLWADRLKRRFPRRAGINSIDTSCSCETNG